MPADLSTRARAHITECAIRNGERCITVLDADVASLTALLEAVRAEALEEAAKVADERTTWECDELRSSSSYFVASACRYIADEIRALKEGKR